MTKTSLLLFRDTEYISHKYQSIIPTVVHRHRVPDMTYNVLGGTLSLTQSIIQSTDTLTMKSAKFFVNDQHITTTLSK